MLFVNTKLLENKLESKTWIKHPRVLVIGMDLISWSFYKSNLSANYVKWLRK